MAATASPYLCAGVCALRGGARSGAGASEEDAVADVEDLRGRKEEVVIAASYRTLWPPKDGLVSFQVARWLGLGKSSAGWEDWPGRAGAPTAGQEKWSGERPQAGSGGGCGSNSVGRRHRHQGQGSHSAESEVTFPRGTRLARTPL